MSYQAGDPLGITVRIALNPNLTANPTSWTWRDVTADVQFADPITVRVGAQDGESDSSSSVELTLRNTSGRYADDNAASDLWPYWGVGTPLQVSTADGQGGTGPAYTVYVAELTPTWPGNSGALPSVRVRADGLFRRLGAGDPIRSPLYTAISGAATPPLDYWPLEEGTLADRATNAMPGRASMLVSAGTVDFGRGAEPPAGSLAVADLSGPGTLQGVVTGATAGDWRLEFIAKVAPVDVGFDTVIARMESDSNVLQWEIGTQPAASGGLYWQYTYRDPAYAGLGSGTAGGLLYGFTSTGKAVDDGRWHHYRWNVAYSGGVMLISAEVDGVSVYTEVGPGVNFGKLTRVTIAPYNATSPAGVFPAAGHVALWSPAPASNPATASATTGYTGELAHARVIRACTEASLPYAVTATTSTAMGPQPIARVLDVLRDAESTDHGMLTDATGIVAYLALNQLYNQTAALTIDGAARQLAGPYAPTTDDQRHRNSVKATRPGGGSGATVEDATDIARRGRYAADLAVNVATDAQLPDHAGWAVARGTAGNRRIGQLTIDLQRSPELIPSWLAVRFGSMLSLVNQPRTSSRDPLSLLVLGWSETIGPGRRTWRATLNTIDAAILAVYVLGGTGNAGRLDGDQQTLSAPVEASTPGAADSLTVATASGPLMTTTATFPADFPFDVNVNGERMTVTAISGSSSPQTATVKRSINGVIKRHATGTAVRLWQPGRLSL